MLVLNGQLKSVDRLAFSPDGSLLTTAGGERKPLDLWAVDPPGQLRHRLPVRLQKTLWSFCFSPADGLLMVADGTEVIAFDPMSATEVWRVRPEKFADIAGLSVSEDGQRLAIAFLFQYLFEGGYQWWELNGRKPPNRKHAINGSPNCMCRDVVVVPSRGWLVAAEDEPPNHSQLHILAPDSAGRILPTTSPAVQQLIVAPEGRYIAAQFPRTVLVWDTASIERAPVTLKNTSPRAFTGVAFHPSGRYLAATSNDATVKLYDTTTWELARTFTWEIGRMRSIAFSPDGTLAAAGSDTGKVVVWDVDV